VILLFGHRVSKLHLLFLIVGEYLGFGYSVIWGSVAALVLTNSKYPVGGNHVNNAPI